MTDEQLAIIRKRYEGDKPALDSGVDFPSLRRTCKADISDLLAEVDRLRKELAGTDAAYEFCVETKGMAVERLDIAKGLLRGIRKHEPLRDVTKERIDKFMEAKHD